MRALLYTPDHELIVTSVDEPAPAEDEVLVRVTAAGVCGSDVHGVASRSERRKPPLIMGHELVGEVVESGGIAGTDLIGKRVAVNPQVPCLLCRDCRSGRENICAHRELIGGTRPGGFAEYVAVPARCAHPFSSASVPEALLAEPLATCVRAVTLARVQPGDEALVIGAGTIGALAANLLRRAGVSTLIVSDPDPLRREYAAQVADAVVLPEQLPAAVADLTGGRGVDLAIDAVGVEPARQSSLELLRRGGVAVWLGMHAEEGLLRGFDVVVREQRIQGSFAYTDPEFAAAVALLESGTFKPQVPLSHVPLAEAAVAFNALLNGKPQPSLKTVIQPGGVPLVSVEAETLAAQVEAS